MLAHLWIGNGYTQEEAFSTYDEKKAELLTVDDAAAAVPRRRSRAPRSAPGSRSRLRRGGVRRGRQLPARHRQQGHGPGDRRPGVRGRGRAGGRRVAGARPGCRRRSSRRASSRASTSTGAPEPTDELRKACADQGHGPGSRRARPIAVRYLGQVFGGEKPFDENFSDTARPPTTFGDRHRRGHQGLGPGARRRPRSAPGWSSRSRRSSATARRATRTPASRRNDTLVFVIDVLAAA